MRKNIAAAALFAALLFASNAFAQKKAAKNGSYAGQYDESMTPENSCVIFFTMPGNDAATFKQINPKLGVDEQSFEYPFGDMQSWTIFKSCKPGSRYMITKMKGRMTGGVVQKGNKLFGSDNVWDMDFKPNQQVLVIDVPNEPGVYTYGMIFAESVAFAASAGEKFTDVQTPNKLVFKGKPCTKQFYKLATKKFQSYYAGTPWMDAYNETAKNIQE